MKLSPSVKVGILTFVSIIILIFALMWLKGRAISTGERIDVEFSDVDGMRPGSAVQIMGIRVGQVEEVYPVTTEERSFVKVRFVITEPNINMPMASTISIQQSGIIGEKFLEITPPQIQTIYLPITKEFKKLLKPDSPIELLVDGEYSQVGKVESSEIVNWESLPQTEKDNIKSKYACKVEYVVNIPGIAVPEASRGKFIFDKKETKVRIVPPADTLVQLAVSANRYTVVEPVRLKNFFDIQLKSAIALRETNEKVNKILSEEAIADLKATLKNTKNLTAEATITLAQANKLIVDSRAELHEVVVLATNLSDKIGILSDNINNVVGDPDIKNNILAITESIQDSASSLSLLINDSNIPQTLKSINSTSQNLSEITQNVKELTNDNEFRSTMSTTILSLNSSLTRLSNVLGSLEGLSDDEKGSLKNVLEDSTEITKNLKEFSEKLNKRFLLFRLMF